jgi:hypothetical protein
VDCFTTTESSFRATPDGSGNYNYDRSTSRAAGAKFGAVMVYFYVDFAQRYIQNTLGFDNICNRPVQFNVNGISDDNSFYRPDNRGTGSLTTGSGGVDDAEDAEVILHEYGHAIQDNSKPNIWGRGGQSGRFAGTGAMGEGFADYWAASITTQHFEQAGTPFATAVMEWDASSYSNANPPTIRSITSRKTYPDDVVDQVHTDGEIWSSTLWQIRNDIGAVAADRVILASHFLLTSDDSTFEDGANAILTAAANLGYPQNQIDAIRARFQQRGITTGGGGGGDLAAPSGLDTVRVKRKRAVLSWTDNSSNEVGFEVAQWDGSEFVVIGSLPAGSTGVRITNLQPRTTYTFSVRAVNGDGASEYAEPVTFRTRR